MITIVRIKHHLTFLFIDNLQSYKIVSLANPSLSGISPFQSFKLLSNSDNISNPEAEIYDSAELGCGMLRLEN